ncbi:hypothetical protein [Komagataeibacter europaeus]|uniref:hypothetical protein n=1 Tax=Komagataeibacter europaeus TaxID=33995 RepID=UPI001E55B5F0|nr:hypothetical protein [Komagataeibacter europaeus]
MKKVSACGLMSDGPTTKDSPKHKEVSGDAFFKNFEESSLFEKRLHPKTFILKSFPMVCTLAARQATAPGQTDNKKRVQP